jgi:hypothetical protein
MFAVLQHQLSSLIEVFGRIPDAFGEFGIAQMDVLVCGPKVPMTGVESDLVQVKFAPSEICQPEMAESVSFEKRQLRTIGCALDDLVPHFESERPATIAARFGNEELGRPCSRTTVEKALTVFDVAAEQITCSITIEDGSPESVLSDFRSDGDLLM